MKATVELPFFIKSETADRDDFDVQIDLLAKILVFDEQHVAELKKDNKHLAVLDVLYVGNGFTLVYSPLFAAKILSPTDDVVVHAYFDEIQKDYDLNPETYFTTKQMQKFKRTNNMPEHLTWDLMKQKIPLVLRSNKIEDLFEQWLAGKQKQMLLTEVEKQGIAGVARKI